MFDRQQLEAFAAVMEKRHFGEAAAVLNVTRGAVSQRLKALEEAVGTPLVVRDGNTPKRTSLQVDLTRLYAHRSGR